MPLLFQGRKNIRGLLGVLPGFCAGAQGGGRPRRHQPAAPLGLLAVPARRRQPSLDRRIERFAGIAIRQQSFGLRQPGFRDERRFAGLRRQRHGLGG